MLEHGKMIWEQAVFREDRNNANHSTLISLNGFLKIRCCLCWTSQWLWKFPKSSPPLPSPLQGSDRRTSLVDNALYYPSPL